MCIRDSREVVPDQVFPTPTGRMELYYDGMVPFDQQLPQWEPCTEIADESLRAQFPLQLTNTRTRFRIHNQFYDSDWLQLMYAVSYTHLAVPLMIRGRSELAQGKESGRRPERRTAAPRVPGALRQVPA